MKNVLVIFTSEPFSNQKTKIISQNQSKKIFLFSKCAQREDFAPETSVQSESEIEI